MEERSPLNSVIIASFRPGGVEGWEEEGSVSKDKEDKVEGELVSWLVASVTKEEMVPWLCSGLAAVVSSSGAAELGGLDDSEEISIGL